MRSSIVRSSCIQGTNAYPIEVEVNLSNGLPFYTVVGLGDSAVRESEQRVKAAIRNSGLRWPDQRITVNLSPAWLSKKGTAFDLPIALAILQASKQIAGELSLSAWGELSLTGQIHSAPGALSLSHGLWTEGVSSLVILPEEARAEVTRFIDGGVYTEDVKSLVSYLQNQAPEISSLRPIERSDSAGQVMFPDELKLPLSLQASAWRACEIALAGAHHLLMLGAAGCGKTTLARACQYMLPGLSASEQYEQALQYSAAKLPMEDFPPNGEASFRSPHFSSSSASLLGGSQRYRLGELTLADKGILFLDEINEFPNPILNQLRQPLEDHEIARNYSGQICHLPARFILIAAANPCSCGLRFEKSQSCTCSDGVLYRYLQKFRNPFFDRIDLTVEMHRLSRDELSATLSNAAPDPNAIRKRILLARQRQFDRQADGNKNLLRLNGWLPASEINDNFGIAPEVISKAETYAEQLKLSIRSFHKLLRVARTISDLEQKDSVSEDHILEAFSYRMADEGARVH